MDNPIKRVLKWILVRLILLVGRLFYHLTLAILMFLVHFPLWIITGFDVLTWWVYATPRWRDRLLRW